jgi:hypothetical protein
MHAPRCLDLAELDIDALGAGERSSGTSGSSRRGQTPVRTQPHCSNQPLPQGSEFRGDFPENVYAVDQRPHLGQGSAAQSSGIRCCKAEVLIARWLVILR